MSPSAENGLSTRELKDVLPENNGEIRPVPQLLVNHPEGFLKGARLLRDLGYREINLNLGCPSGTVTAKKKGSGLLMYPEELDALLDRIFSDPMVTGGEILVSVKTRIGKNSPEEWPQLMEIYNQYPIYELTIHPRIQKDFIRTTRIWRCFPAPWRPVKIQWYITGIFLPRQITDGSGSSFRRWNGSCWAGGSSWIRSWERSF